MGQPGERSGRGRGFATAACALCLGWLAVALAATRGEPPLTPDSTEYAVIARNLAEGRGYALEFVGVHLGLEEQVRRVPELHGLLQPLLLAGLFAGFGPEAPLVRVPGLLAVALTGLLAFLFGRRLFGPWPGLFACGFALAQPLAFVLAWTGNDDAGAMALLLASLFFLHRALDRQRTADFALAGGAAALALAQKGTALLLLAAFAWPLWLRARGAGRPSTRQIAWLVAPFLGVFGLYLLRNLAAHGSLSARFTVVDWMWKAEETWKLETFFALHETLPSLPELLHSLGARKLATDALRQLALVGGWIFRLGPALHWSLREAGLSMPGFAAPLGLLGLAAVARRERSFAALVTLAALGAVGLVCGLYHASLRFFLFLAPLLGIALAGLLARLHAGAADRRTARAQRAAVLGVALAVLGTGGFAWAETALFGPRLAPTRGLGPCQALLRRFVETTPSDARLLSFAPWSVAWETRREAIQIPAGGPDAIARVARHYDARWILVQPHPERPLTLRALEILEHSGAAGLRAHLEHQDGRCTLLRLEPSA